MKFVNLTPHMIRVRNEGGDFEFPPSGQVARVEESALVANDAPCGFEIVDCVLGEPYGLPDPVDGTIYIVSPMVSGACKGRQDVVAPDTGPASVVRDSDGKIIAVRRFRRMV